MANRCPKCQTINRDGAKFCSRCGHLLPASSAAILCPSCGTSNRAQARFCVGCGTTLAPAVLPGKRRLTLSKKWVIALAGVGLVVFLAAAGLWGVLGDRGGQEPSPTPSLIEVATRPADIPIPPTAMPRHSTPPATAPIAIPTSIIIPGMELELPQLTEEEEIEIGRQAGKELEDEYGLSDNPEYIQRVTQVSQQIVPFCDRPHLPYTFQVLDEEEINGFAMPGGGVYLTEGLLEFVQSDDELAGVIGHEIAHIAKRHGAQRIEAMALVHATAKAIGEENPDLRDIYEQEEVKLASELARSIGFTK
jgi:hypothetical protein